MEEIDKIHYRFSAPIQIKMCDLDPFAHVNNGVQCNYFDYGRSQYFEKVFGEKIDWTTMDMVLAHISLDFKLPIKIHDEIICQTTVKSLGNKSLQMIQQLKDQQSGQVKTICESVLVGFDRESEKSIPIREEYKKALIKFEQL